MDDPARERLILYELCVQRPEAVVRLIRAAMEIARPGIERKAGVLHEDFSGSGAVSRRWVAADPSALAVATDIDPAVLEFGRERAAAKGIDPHRLVWRSRDLRAACPSTEMGADAVFVGNFSIGELHTRGELLAYLRSARARLNPGGIFICDTYGGAAAFRTGLVHRTHPGRSPGERLLYTWEQRSHDPYTARVINALHFRIERDGEIISAHFDAFIYHWRLWSVPELRDAMIDAGFAATRVMNRLDVPSSVDPPDDPRAAAEHHIVCVLGIA